MDVVVRIVVGFIVRSYPSSRQTVGRTVLAAGYMLDIEVKQPNVGQPSGHHSVRKVVRRLIKERLRVSLNGEVPPK
jgi:hypothetical protein